MKTNVMTTLVIVTGSFPYDVAKEDTFLSLELLYLSKVFDKIIILPQKISNNKCSIPNNVEVDESIVRNNNIVIIKHFRMVLEALLLPLFWKEIYCFPTILFNFTSLARLIYLAGTAGRIKKLFRSFIEIKKIDIDNTIFYTYWLEGSTLGLGLLKHEIANIVLVSRAHGGDLYAFRFPYEYIPLQLENIKQLDRLYLISEHGKRYIDSRYPVHKEMNYISRLGVVSHNIISHISSDGIYRIISCAFIVGVKRLDLLLMGLIELANWMPNLMFEWYHIGDGPLLLDLQRQANGAPSNLHITFTGYLTNNEVLQFYRDTTCDVFVNTSSSEGISVAMMEAASCGIPIVATAVGGTPEIVSDRNGILLSENPTPIQIANAIWDILKNSHYNCIKRNESYSVWMKFYNGDLNFSNFATQLRSLLDKQQIQ
jgi:colanic acid/amylovoran biosynthesis glycosyltransferase